jgi:hypothetical protein
VKRPLCGPDSRKSSIRNNELKEEDTSRVVVQQETKSVP